MNYYFQVYSLDNRIFYLKLFHLKEKTNFKCLPIHKRFSFYKLHSMVHNGSVSGYVLCWCANNPWNFKPKIKCGKNFKSQIEFNWIHWNGFYCSTFANIVCQPQSTRPNWVKTRQNSIIPNSWMHRQMYFFSSLISFDRESSEH